MKQKLLFLLISMVFSVVSYAQYGTPVDLSQCNNEVFNLTINTPLVLNGQNPATHTVSYYLSQADAMNVSSPIADPANFVAASYQVIYGRIDHAGQYSLFSFTVQWGISQQIPPTPAVIVCDAYELPPLADGLSYYTAPNGGGTLLQAGTMITTTSTIYVSSGTGQCANQSGFVVTIVQTPPVEQFENVTVCGSYTLPVLLSGAQYYTLPNGAGPTLAAGTVINASTTLYIRNGSFGIPVCVAESSFTVTVNPASDLTVFVSPQATTICMGASVTLTASASSSSVTYLWNENGQPIPGATQPSIMVSPGSTSVYECEISNGSCTAISPQVTVTVLQSPGMEIILTGEACLGGDFTLAVINPSPSTSYVWSHDPVGGSVPVTTASTYTINNAVAQDTGTYTCTAVDACGAMFINTITVIIGTCNNNTISGHVRFDADANGCDSSDSGVPNVAIAKYKGNEVSYAYTDANGAYSFSNVPEGSQYVVLQNPVPGYYLVSPEPPGSIGFTVAGDDNELTGDFCLGAPQLIKDAKVYFYANTGARPGFPAQYTMVVYNAGGLPVSGPVSVSYNPGMLDFVNAIPAITSQDNTPQFNTLHFALNNLPPFGFAFYTLHFTVKVPPIVNAGDILDFSAMVSIADDVNSLDNETTMQQTVVNSFDPNDIAVRQGAQIYESQLGSYLDYTIRFQNTGTAEAINVRVTNELDALLDWSTFQPVYSSHLYRAERSGGSVTFSFDDINLPAQSVDDAGSNGLVSYRIKPKTGVAIGDVMKAQASIYFDFNLPIITNEVETEVVAPMSTPETVFANLKMHPNPASAKVAIDLGADVKQAEAVVYDIQGKTIMTAKSVGHSIELNVSSVKSGMYFVKVLSGTASVVKKLVVK